MDYDNLNIKLFIALFILIMLDVYTTYYSLEIVNRQYNIMEEKNPLVKTHFTDKNKYTELIIIRILFLLMLPFGFRLGLNPKNFNIVLIILVTYFSFVIIGNSIELLKVHILYLR